MGFGVIGMVYIGSRNLVWNLVLFFLDVFEVLFIGF